MNLIKPPSAIIYSKDFEPISHIPMNEEMYNYFINYKIVRFPIMKPINIESLNDSKIMPEELLYAEIMAMPVYASDGIRLILTAINDETALLMRNTFLPGQTKELNFIKTQAFYKGMIKAIKEIKKQ